MKKSYLIVALFFIVSLIISIYLPNINGSFILDDFANLSSLNQFNDREINLTNIISYISNNTSGQLGRPLSLFSFSLQAESWPDNPGAFRLVNIIIHLANGLILILISRIILQSFISSNATRWSIALLVSGLWLMQPIHVSTVLYVVQRMTLLMGFFSLLAILGYLYGRSLSEEKNGIFVSAFAVLIGTACALFSKENGILVFLYIAVIELTLYANHPPSKNWKRFIRFFIYAPLLIGGLYFIYKTPDYINGHTGRNFTFGEHLLTETRIVIDYLTKILFPRPDSFGLFFDDFPISTSLLSPINTLTSTAILAGLFVSALVYRRKAPIYSFAILWFLAGHSLESTIIPLELYFEHRNYLPAFGIVFALCYYAYQFINKASATYVKVCFVSLAVLYGIGICFIAFQEARLWNNSGLQALTWQKNHPTSKRANALAAQTWIDLNNPIEADRQLQRIHQLDPDDSAAYIMRLEINCYTNNMDKKALSDIAGKLERTTNSNATVMAIKNLVNTWGKRKCSMLSAEYLEKILASRYEKTTTPRLKEHIVQSFSLFYAHNNNYDAAVGILEDALKIMPAATGLILLKIRWAIASRQYSVALSWIDSARHNHSAKRLNKINFENQLRIMENDIHKIINNQRENPA